MGKISRGVPNNVVVIWVEFNAFSLITKLSNDTRKNF